MMSSTLPGVVISHLMANGNYQNSLLVGNCNDSTSEGFSNS